MPRTPRTAARSPAKEDERLRILEAATSGDQAVARDLIREYAESLEIDLKFQDFEGELASFPGEYAPPSGAVLLAIVGGVPAGVVALRAQPDGSCEMKRLYVRPRFRGRGVGRRLAAEIVARAAGRGYTTMRLDTLATMEAALDLYRKLGFRDIAPYRYNPIPGARFLELDLRRDRTLERSEGSSASRSPDLSHRSRHGTEGR
jgi:putative acetyltransferase